jgi:hypothetical protein
MMENSILYIPYIPLNLGLIAMRPTNCRCFPEGLHLSTFRLTIIGIVALFFALATARADKAEDVIIVAPADYDQAEASAVDIGSLGDILTPAELDSLLNAGSGLGAAAETLDLNILEVADQDADAEILTLAGPGKVNTVGLRDVLPPAGLLVLGTALTSFAFLTRRRRHHSRRIYYSTRSVIARPPSKIPPLQTSPSADSCEPNPRENSVHSSPRRRLA